MSGREPRIRPGGRREIGLLNAGIARVIGLAAGGESRRPPRVFTTLARHRGLFRRWLVFAGGLMPGGLLARQETELVILRVAHNSGCDYELAHHVRLGRRVGLTEGEIATACGRGDTAGWPPRRALALEAADALHADGVVGDALWDRLTAAFGEAELIELCMLVGHYEMLAMTLNSLRVQPEPEFAGSVA